MSMDHVIVGGGHFVERGGMLIQEFVEKAPDLMSAFQRATGELELTRHVTSQLNERMLSQIDGQLNNVSSSDRSAAVRLISDGNDNNFVDFTGSDRGTDGGVDRSWGTIDHFFENNRSAPAPVEYNRTEAFLERQSEMSKEITQDMLEALGWAAAGRPDMALEKGVEAVAKQGQMVYESTMDLIDKIFGR